MAFSDDDARQGRIVAELERLNRAKGDFMSIVSHEFRTPLTGIQGFSEICSLPAVSAGRDKITQVLTNLISNAIKYSPSGRTIVLTSRGDSGSIHVSVRDHGMGIANEDREKIFDRFTRVQAEATRACPGSRFGSADRPPDRRDA